MEIVSQELGWTVCTPPATLLEVVATGDEDRRRKMVELLSSGLWVRLRTEADQEASEVVGEVRRLRPNWLRQIAAKGDEARHRTYWTKTVWRQARNSLDRLHQASKEVHAGAIQYSYESQLSNRRVRIESGLPPITDLSNQRVVPNDSASPAYLKGWEAGVAVDWWRVHGRDVFASAIHSYEYARARRSQSAYGDWLDVYVNLSKIQSDWPDFTRFWFDEVDRSRMPRIWTRWAVQTAQLNSKVTSSSGGDDQLSTYLTDCEVFVTGDRRLARAIELAEKSSLHRMPRVVVMSVPKLEHSALDLLAALVTAQGS